MNIFKATGSNQPPDPTEPLNTFASALSEHYDDVVVIVSTRTPNGTELYKTFRGSHYAANGMVLSVVETTGPNIFQDDDIV